MPYVTQERRNHLDKHIDEVAGRIGSAGDLAYAVYRLARSSRLPRDRYEDLALIHGVLDATATEFLLRVIGPYEDRKREENGDVS